MMCTIVAGDSQAIEKQKVDYWDCVEDCIVALFSTSPHSYTDIQSRLDIIDLLLSQEDSARIYKVI